MTVDSAALQKSRIAKQFSRAAHTYDSAADVQLDIAFDALSMVPSKPDLALDIGCGTGRVTQQLEKKCHHLLAMDLAFGMLEYAQIARLREQYSTRERPIQWLQGDAEQLPVAKGAVDLVFSSMALQWCSDEVTVMSEISRVMKPKATAILAIMCAGSFNELNETWCELDKKRHTNDFLTPAKWLKAAKAQGLLVSVETKDYVTWHQNIRSLFSSIKSVGANVVLANKDEVTHSNKKEKSPLNRDTLKHLERNYQKKYSKNSQLPLTYKVCFLHCTKP